MGVQTMTLGGAILGLFHRPTQAMETLAGKPRSWIWAALLIVASMMVLLVVSGPYQLELTNERQAEAIERMTADMAEEQAELIRERTKPTTMTQLVLIGGLTAAALMAIGWVVRAAVVHFSSTSIGGHSIWGATFSVAVWSMIPTAVSSLVSLVFVLLNGRVAQHSGLGMLVTSGDWLKDSRSWQYALASAVDPFTLWQVVLFAIAISVACKVSRAKGAVLSLVLFVLSLGLKLVPVLISSAVGGAL